MRFKTQNLHKMQSTSFVLNVYALSNKRKIQSTLSNANSLVDRKNFQIAKSLNDRDSNYRAF